MRFAMCARPARRWSATSRTPWRRTASWRTATWRGAFSASCWDSTWRILSRSSPRPRRSSMRCRRWPGCGHRLFRTRRTRCRLPSSVQSARASGERAMSVHVGESVEEVQFLRDGTGAWRDLLEELGVWNDAWPPPGAGRWSISIGSGWSNRRLLAVQAYAARRRRAGAVGGGGRDAGDLSAQQSLDRRRDAADRPVLRLGRARGDRDRQPGERRGSRTCSARWRLCAALLPPAGRPSHPERDDRGRRRAWVCQEYRQRSNRASGPTLSPSESRMASRMWKNTSSVGESGPKRFAGSPLNGLLQGSRGSAGFYRVRFYRVRFYRVRFYRVRFYRVRFYRVRFYRVRFYRVRFYRVRFYRVRFYRVRFYRVRFYRVRFYRVRFYRVRFYRVRFYRVRFYRVRFYRVRFYRVRFSGSVLPGSVLPGSVLPGSVLPGSVLPGSVLPGSVLPGSGIYRVQFYRVRFCAVPRGSARLRSGERNRELRGPQRI